MKALDRVPGKVLIADDDPAIRKAFRMLLEDEGYLTAVAEEGRQATELIQTEKPDVILLDLLMPGVSGLEVLQQLQAAGPGAPVVVIITAQASADNAIAALKAGAYDLLRKPFTADELLASVRRAFERRCLLMDNLRLVEELKHQLAEQAMLMEAGRLFNSTLNLPEVLDLVMQNAQDILLAEASSLMFRDPATGELYFTVAHGERGERVKEVRLPRGQGIAGWVAERGEPLLVEDAQRHPRFYAKVDELTGFVTRTMACVPIVVKGETIGVIEVLNRRGGGVFTPPDLAILAAIAAQAGIAIENARLHGQVTCQAADLALKVQERTQELQTANVRLEEASRHKSEFLANMSHELRTPMNAILGFTDLILEGVYGPVPPGLGEPLKDIKNSGKHLLQLINDVLDLSKVEAGKLVLHPEVLPVAETVEGILVVARGLAYRKGQTVEAALAPALPPLRADPVRFKQICFNLLSNAMKFTPAQGQITLTARAVAAEGRKQTAESSGQLPTPEDQDSAIRIPQSALEIRVTDTGPGIKAADMPRLFQDFVQLEATATKRHEGTGLGLALTKRLVELHGGRIWAESEGAGKGSTFSVVLPFDGPAEPPGPVERGIAEEVTG